MKKLIVFVIALGFLSSCAVVKEYEKVNINDPDMALGDKTIKRFETIAQSYR